MKQEKKMQRITSTLLLSFLVLLPGAAKAESYNGFKFELQNVTSSYGTGYDGVPRVYVNGTYESEARCRPRVTVEFYQGRNRVDTVKAYLPRSAGRGDSILFYAATPNLNADGYKFEAGCTGKTLTQRRVIPIGE